MKALLTTVACAAALAVAGPAAAENWNAFSRSGNAAYMADVDSIVVEGDVTRITLAIVPLRGEAGDLSHTVDSYEFRCDSGQWRTRLSIEYGADGVEADRYPEDPDWTPMRADTVPAILKTVACDGMRANPPVWPTVRAFIEAGRPVG